MRNKILALCEKYNVIVHELYYDRSTPLSSPEENVYGCWNLVVFLPDNETEKITIFGVSKEILTIIEDELSWLDNDYEL